MSNRIVIKTSEDSTISRASMLPMEIGIVVDTPTGQPNTPITVSSEAELIKRFGTPTKDYPVYDMVRALLRMYYGVTISKVATKDGVGAKVTVVNDTDEALIELSGVSKSDYENGCTVRFVESNEVLNLSLIRYTTPQGTGDVMEVLTGLDNSSIDNLVYDINNRSYFLKAENISGVGVDGPVKLDTDFILEGGERGVVIEAEQVIDAINAFDSPYVTRVDILTAPGLNIDPLVVQAGVDVASNRYETSFLSDFYLPNKIVKPDEVLIELAQRPASNMVRYYYPDMYMSLPTGTHLIPASAAVLFTYARASLTNLWTAPAGYSTELAIPYAQRPSVTMNSELASQLYDHSPSCNPITYDSAYGYIIDGVRTGGNATQYTRSITSAAMSNYLRYEVHDITKKYQYKPNTETTWDAWNLEVSGLLDNVRISGGIERYEVFMGRDTMTDSEIRSGVLKGIVRVLPTSAIEYIEISIALTNLEGSETTDLESIFDGGGF